MAGADLFNNSSNNYIYPDLKLCSNSNSNNGNIFGFLDKGKVGVTNGANIISYIDFSDIKIPLEGYTRETKIIQSGEVIFINGLTKRLLYREETFNMPNFVAQTTRNPYFMTIDMSINYYKNFRIISDTIDVSANYKQNISIDNALNTYFNSKDIKIISNIDASYLGFTGTVEGYDFEVTNVVLTITDVSVDASSPFNYNTDPSINNLVHNISLDIPAARYPNTADRGIALKATYPASSQTSDATDYNKWIYFAHAQNTVNMYSPIDLTLITDVCTYQNIQFEPSVNIQHTKPIINYTITPSMIGSVTVSDVTIDDAIIDDYNIIECSINTSSISSSYITLSRINDSSIQTSFFESCSSINNSILIDSSILDSVIRTSNIVNDYLENGSVYNSNINNSFILNTELFTTTIIDSSIKGLLLNDDCSISRCLIENVFSNAYILIVNPSTGEKIYVVDDDTLDIDLIGNRNYFHNVDIWDSSINNAEIRDSSLYRTIIYDSSVINCTTYNCVFVRSSDINNTTVMIDAIIDCSTVIVEDTSTYYNQEEKIVNLAMNGCNIEALLGTGDFLEYLTSNNLWNKMGSVYILTTAPDNETDPRSENLANGLFLYNPQSFPVQIDYMTIL